MFRPVRGRAGAARSAAARAPQFTRSAVPTCASACDRSEDGITIAGVPSGTRNADVLTTHSGFFLARAAGCLAADEIVYRPRHDTLSPTAAAASIQLGRCSTSRASTGLVHSVTPPSLTTLINHRSLQTEWHPMKKRTLLAVAGRPLCVQPCRCPPTARGAAERALNGTPPLLQQLLPSDRQGQGRSAAMDATYAPFETVSGTTRSSASMLIVRRDRQGMLKVTLSHWVRHHHRHS